jgi:two-component system sensor histidine kinase PilS (NtrC family)
VGLTLLTVFSQNLMASRLGNLEPSLFLWVILSYTLINLGSVVLVSVIPQRFFAGQYISFSLVAYDVFALTWLTYLSGGVASGLGLLILVSVSTGPIIVTGRATTLLAALASIALLYEEFYLSLSAPTLLDD